MSSGVTVCLTVDYDAVSVWRMHGAVGARGLSRGEFGVTEGAPRLLESLERHGVTATWFVPGITARQYPKSVAGVATAGHEIANHGYFHEDFAALSPDDARSAIRRGNETLAEITGQRPVGARLPGGDLDGVNLEILADEGFLYDSSLIGGYRPSWAHGGHTFDDEGMLQRGAPLRLVELPWSYLASDKAHFEINHSGPLFPTALANPRQLEEVWRDEIDDLIGRDPEGFMMLIVHPQVIGRGSRLAMLERIIEYAQSRSCRFATARTLAEEFRTQHLGIGEAQSRSA